MSNDNPDNVDPHVDDLTLEIRATVVVSGDAMRLDGADPAALIVGATQAVGQALSELAPDGSEVSVSQDTGSSASFTSASSGG